MTEKRLKEYLPMKVFVLFHAIALRAHTLIPPRNATNIFLSVAFPLLPSGSFSLPGEHDLSERSSKPITISKVRKQRQVSYSVFLLS
jgi:hypothetical protein